MRAALGLMFLALVGAGSLLAVRVALDASRWLDALTSELGALASVAPTVPAPIEAAVVTIDAATGPRAAPSRALQVVEPGVLSPSDVVDELRARFCLLAAERLCGARPSCACMREAPGCAQRVEAACSDFILRAADQFPVASLVEIDDPVLDACLSGLSHLGEHCDLRDAWRAGCHMPLVEAADVGQPCRGTHTRCREGFCSDGLCVRSGFPLFAGERGENCRHTAQCAPPLSCRDSRCLPRPAHGEVCDPVPCALGLVCDWHEAPYARCVTAPTWCDSGEDCGDGSTCIEGRCEDRVCDPGAIVALFEPDA